MPVSRRRSCRSLRRSGPPCWGHARVRRWTGPCGRRGRFGGRFGGGGHRPGGRGRGRGRGHDRGGGRRCGRFGGCDDGPGRRWRRDDHDHLRTRGCRRRCRCRGRRRGRRWRWRDLVAGFHYDGRCRRGGWSFGGPRDQPRAANGCHEEQQQQADQDRHLAGRLAGGGRCCAWPRTCGRGAGRGGRTAGARRGGCAPAAAGDRGCDGRCQPCVGLTADSRFELARQLPCALIAIGRLFGNRLEHHGFHDPGQIRP